jgi:hypothetical protein
METCMYTQSNQEKEHTEGPYIITDCIAIQINDYLEAAGITPGHPEYERAFDRLLDYSEWLEDRFGRGLCSIEAIAHSFLEEYSDLCPDEIVESLERLRADILRMIEALELAISRVKLEGESAN